MRGILKGISGSNSVRFRPRSFNDGILLRYNNVNSRRMQTFSLIREPIFTTEADMIGKSRTCYTSLRPIPPIGERQILVIPSMPSIGVPYSFSSVGGVSSSSAAPVGGVSSGSAAPVGGVSSGSAAPVGGVSSTVSVGGEDKNRDCQDGNVTMDDFQSELDKLVRDIPSDVGSSRDLLSTAKSLVSMERMERRSETLTPFDLWYGVTNSDQDYFGGVKSRSVEMKNDAKNISGTDIGVGNMCMAGAILSPYTTDIKGVSNDDVKVRISADNVNTSNINSDIEIDSCLARKEFPKKKVTKFSVANHKEYGSIGSLQVPPDMSTGVLISYSVKYGEPISFGDEIAQVLVQDEKSDCIVSILANNIGIRYINKWHKSIGKNVGAHDLLVSFVDEGEFINAYKFRQQVETIGRCVTVIATQIFCLFIFLSFILAVSEESYHGD